VSDRASAKPHADAGADRGGKPTRKRLPSFDASQRPPQTAAPASRPIVHQAGQSRLDILQHEHAPPRLVFFKARTSGLRISPVSFTRELLVALLLLGKVAQQAPHADIVGLFARLGVEALGLQLIVSTSLRMVSSAGSWSARSGAASGSRGRSVAADRRQMRAENAVR